MRMKQRCVRRTLMDDMQTEAVFAPLPPNSLNARRMVVNVKTLPSILFFKKAGEFSLGLIERLQHP